MANIIIDSFCNLKCPYCFANDVIQKNKDFISLEQFDHILDFIYNSKENRVGLIGGEPLLHPKFKEICEHIIKKTPNDFLAVVYTNGTLLDKYLEILSNVHFRMLINVNSPEDQGTENYQKLLANLDKVFNSYYMDYKITLGVNLYKKDQDLQFFYDIIDRYPGHIRAIRTSLSIPMDKTKGAFHLFDEMLPLAKSLLKEMVKRGIGVLFDCNQIPLCLIDEEMAKLMFESEKISGKPYVTGNCCSACTPVIDIDQRGYAIRCFAFSEYEKVHIDDFETTGEIVAYYRHQIDRILRNNPLDKCKDCHEFKCDQCTGGCLSFRLDLFNK